MKVKCPACQKNHGELAPGDYRCVCTAEFRVESQDNPVENPGMSYRPDEIAETMEGVSKELYGALWKIVVTLKPTQAVYYDGLTERQLVNRMKKNKESAETIANLKEVLKKEEAELRAWMDEGRQNPFGLASLRKHRHNWMPTGPATAQGQKSVCLDRECGLRAMVHNPHQAGQGRITPEGWREHQKHIPIPKGWQLAPSKGPVGMRVAKPRPGMVWIVQSSGAVTAPPTRAQREGKGVPKKYGHKTGRRASAPAAPGSFEQYTKEEGMEWPRSTPGRASDPSAPGAPPESYVSQISARMGEEARKKFAGSNPLDMPLTEREQRGIGSRLSLVMDRGVQKGILAGIDMKPAPVVFRNDDVVVLKMAGRRDWVGRKLGGGSMTTYTGAEYQVYLRLPGEDSSMVRQIASWPVRG